MWPDCVEIFVESSSRTYGLYFTLCSSAGFLSFFCVGVIYLVVVELQRKVGHDGDKQSTFGTERWKRGSWYRELWKSTGKIEGEGKDPRIAGGRDWVGKSLTDPVYRLWEKEQVVVLLSRTVSAKDIVFVGSPSPRETIDAILQVIQSISGGHQRRLTALSVCNSK